MSVFSDTDKNDLEYEIRTFLESHTISELLDVVKWCVEAKEMEGVEE